jgi:hypothetical protein
MSDVFSLWALKTCVKYLPRVAKNPDDREAKRQMLLVILFLKQKKPLNFLWTGWLLRLLVLGLEMPGSTCVTVSVTR